MAPHAKSLVHPGCPQSHGSRCAFFIPQDSIVLTDHSPAAFRFGVPVTRGPYTSVRKCSVRMTCEWLSPSSRIPASLDAGVSAACCGVLLSAAFGLLGAAGLGAARFGAIAAPITATAT